MILTQRHRGGEAQSGGKKMPDGMRKWDSESLC